MAEKLEQDALIELTAEIVAAFVSNNDLAPKEVPQLIGSVHGALSRMSGADSGPPPQEPAVAVRRSITPDYIVCLEDGKCFKSLKRHLQTRYGLTPAEYRTKWGLPPDYPMVAPNYAKARSNLAREMGLGQRRRRA